MRTCRHHRRGCVRFDRVGDRGTVSTVRDGLQFPDRLGVYTAR
jgi:hypothetical protein